MTFVNKTLEEMLGSNHELVYSLNVTPTINGEILEARSNYWGFITKEQEDELFSLINAKIRTALYEDAEDTLMEIIDNAFNRGNMAFDKPITINLYETNDKIAVQIKDSGSGFDYKTKIAQLNAGEVYFQGHGCGLRRMKNSEWEISYEGNGNTVNVLIPKERKNDN